MGVDNTSEDGRIIKYKIREFDPFAAQALADYCDHLLQKKRSNLKISESLLLASVEMQCSDEEQVMQRELAGVIRSAKRILENSVEEDWTNEHKQLFLVLKKIVFIGLDDENESSDSELINSVVEGLMRLDYSNDIPIFKVVEQEKNIFNYFGFILDSLQQKFRESTVSSKAVNAILEGAKSDFIFITNEFGLIRFVSRKGEDFVKVSLSELLDRSISDFFPSWKGLNLTDLHTQAHRSGHVIDINVEGSRESVNVEISEVNSHDGFEDDEVKEFILRVNLDASFKRKNEKLNDDLTLIDEVINSIRSLKDGQLADSDRNTSLDASIERLLKLNFLKIDKSKGSDS